VYKRQGGNILEVHYQQTADLTKIREKLNTFPEIQVQNFGTSKDVLIRLPAQKNINAAQQTKQVMDILQASNPDMQLKRSESVGPQVGDELTSDGLKALLCVCIGIMLYLAMRFEWKFAVAAIIANLHDVIIILGFFAFFQWEFSLPVLAGVLAVLGYSVNESVVVFDRIRENFRHLRQADTVEVINNAITSTISRTIITHGCTQMMVTSMLFFGGEVLHNFALALTIGICFGIYSSVLVASPLVMWLGITREDLVKASAKNSDDELADEEVNPNWLK
jgi:preprotein translocase subunit SecF